MSVSESHPDPINCKISKLNRQKELALSYSNAKLIFLAHSCNTQKITELLYDEPSANPNTALYPNGPTALSAISSRVFTDTGYINECLSGYRLLKKHSGQNK